MLSALGKFRSHLHTLGRSLTDQFDLQLSRNLDISACQSLCLTLGPYRNLTTLTAATLFLHPHCQVLNHAGERVFKRHSLNFLEHYSSARMDRFIRYAIRISRDGSRGTYGGSITHSHAWDPEHAMGSIAAGRETALLKSEIRCLFWKESLVTTNLIRKHDIDLGRILDQDARLRFLLPIRNPLDCVLSNIKTNHVEQFLDLDRDPSFTAVLAAVLDQIAWFADWQRRYPERFFHYFEHEISSDMLTRLASFLDLEPTSSWLSAALDAMTIDKRYVHEETLWQAFEHGVGQRFAAFPAFQGGLLAFTPGAGAASPGQSRFSP